MSVSRQGVSAHLKSSKWVSILTYCGIFAVSCSLCQTHGVLADLRGFSLSELPQAGHGGTAQQQMGAGQVNLNRKVQWWSQTSWDSVLFFLFFSLCKQSRPYAETGHKAGQVDMAWREHVQLLQAWDGRCLHEGVGVVLHYGTADQAGGADGGDGGSVSYIKKKLLSNLSLFSGKQKTFEQLLFFLRSFLCFTGVKMLFCHLLAERKIIARVLNNHKVTTTKSNQVVVYKYPVIPALQWWWELPDSDPNTGAPPCEMGAQWGAGWEPGTVLAPRNLCTLDHWNPQLEPESAEPMSEEKKKQIAVQEGFSSEKIRTFSVLFFWL